jgi:outer membrane receptor protein involved in Fe transport
VLDNFSKLVGRHAFKFGGDYRLIRYVQNLPTNDDGTFFFGTGSNSTGDPFADFVLGLPGQFEQGSTSNQRLHTHQVNFYAQDTWQIRSNLTLNYGLRWELNTPYIEKNNELDFIQPPAPGQAPPQSMLPGCCPGQVTRARDPRFIQFALKLDF